jgi:hypothetical protein
LFNECDEQTTKEDKMRHLIFDVLKTCAGQPIRSVSFNSTATVRPFLKCAAKYKFLAVDLHHAVISNCTVGLNDLKLFDSFPKLESLQLRENILPTIHRALFVNLTNLVRLEIESELSCLDDDSFIKLIDLKVLKIHAIKSRDRKPSSIKYSSKLQLPSSLEELSLFNFSFDPVKSQVFSNLPATLKKLELIKCKISSFEPSLFSHHIALDELIIESCSLREFVTNFYPRSLILGGNTNLESVKLTASETDLANVEEININSNREYDFSSSYNMSGLKTLTINPKIDTCFHQFTCLERLDMQLENKAMLEGGKLKCLSKLKELALYMNKNG